MGKVLLAKDWCLCVGPPLPIQAPVEKALWPTTLISPACGDCFLFLPVMGTWRLLSNRSLSSPIFLALCSPSHFLSLLFPGTFLSGHPVPQLLSSPPYKKNSQPVDERMIMLSSVCVFREPPSRKLLLPLPGARWVGRCVGLIGTFLRPELGGEGGAGASDAWWAPLGFVGGLFWAQP